MENIAKKVIIMVLSIGAIWIITLGMTVAAIVFLVKAALIVLVPVVGQANAYLICGVLCVFPLLIFYGSLNSKSSISKRKLDINGGLSADGISQMIRKHPLEAVTIAFTLGFSMEDVEELNKVVRAASRHAIRL